MVDSLQIAAAVIVVFVLALATEIIFAFCRVYAWLRRRLRGGTDVTVVPPGRYRRGSISHSWSEASIENSTLATTVAAPVTSTVPPVRLYTPADELLHSHRETVLNESVVITATASSKIETEPTESHARRRERSRRSPGDRPQKLMFSSDFIKSVEQDWQNSDFGCTHCSENLNGRRYLLHDAQPYCKKCYEKLFANSCFKCKQLISGESKDLCYHDKHWHDDCFKCNVCASTLVDQPFAFKNDQLICAGCYETLFAPRCTACGKQFRTGMKKYEHKGRQWHAECFHCKICQLPIGTNSFIPRGQDVICTTCYERQFSQKCTVCHGVINRGGIMYKNAPCHRECFTCTQCQKNIGIEKFTSVEDHPYCVRCYGRLFAKKCYSCCKAITGIEDSKFISFDSRQWHNGCFKCFKCDKPLVGRGFLTDGSDILCPDCCKED